MKHVLTLTIAVLLLTPNAHASWFSSGPDPLTEAKDKITVLENQITTQAAMLNRWQLATGSLAVACSILLIIGTALGAKTRKHYYESSSARRMGGAASLNGRKSNLGPATDEEHHATLAA